MEQLSPTIMERNGALLFCVKVTEKKIENPTEKLIMEKLFIKTGEL